MERKYVYKMIGVTDEEAVVKAVKKKQGVTDCYVEDGKIVYTLDESGDEYQVLLEANEMCSKYDGELVYDDGDGEETETGDSSGVEGEIAPGDENEPQTQPDSAAPDAKKSIFADEEIDYNEVDKIVSDKKKNKTNHISKFCEIGVALILFIVCLFIPGDPTEFGFKTILSVLAFALGGYEVFYAAITDIVRKKFLSENVIMTLIALMGALLGYVTETTAIVIAFAVAYEIAVLADDVASLKLEEAFYTGSVAVAFENGATKKICDIIVGDRTKLGYMDVVPCDGVAEGEAKLDTYRISGIPETEVKKGDKVYAGSVVLSDGLIVTVEKTNKESMLPLKRAAFGATLGEMTKTPKWAFIANAVILFVGIATTFLAPLITGGEYADGLREWGARAIAVMSSLMIIYVVYLSSACLRNAFIAARYEQIEFKDVSSVKKLAKADTFVFLASTLTENGKIKQDAYGCMNELLSLGVRNVRTEFDVPTDEQTKAKLTFVQKKVAAPKEIVVGRDVTLSGDGGINIVTGELSFIPLAYKKARSAFKRSVATLIMACVFAAISVTAAFVVPTTVLSPVYAGAFFLVTTLIYSFMSLLSAGKNV